MDSMYEYQVLNLVVFPNRVKLIGCKWIFKIKIDMEGKHDIFKAILVKKGWKQVHGMDYEETFSSVAMFKYISIILVIAAHYD